MRYPLWRVGVFIAAAIWPLLWLYQAWSLALGPDPGKVMVDRLGLGTLDSVVGDLEHDAVAEAQWLVGLDRGCAGNWVCGVLPMWCCIWRLTWCLYSGWTGRNWRVELRKRPYIIVGALGFLCLLALAVTSNRYSQRRLGKGWKKLHRLAYVVLGLGLLHMLWIVRADPEGVDGVCLYRGAAIGIAHPGSNPPDSPSCGPKARLVTEK